MKIKLTAPMTSALECREDGGLEPLVDQCWDRKAEALVFKWHEADTLLSELTEMANAEDAQAEEQGDKFARKACTSLTFLAGRLTKLMR